MASVLRDVRGPTKYGFAVGRARVLETKLITLHKFERLVEAKDSEAQMRVLAETDYRSYFEDFRTPEGIEEALHTYLASVYKFLEEVTPDPELTTFFRVRYDFHNLKVLLKAKYAEKTGDYIWSGLGTLNIEKVKELIDQEKIENLPSDYKPYVKKAISVFEQTKDSQQIDVILDQGLYERLFDLASAQKNSFLKKLVQILIDLANLKVWLRARNLERGKDFIANALLEHSSVSKPELILLYQEPLEKLLERYRSTSYRNLLQEVIKGKEIDLSQFDKLADDFIITYAKEAKYIVAGLEPLVAYILAKENEVKLVRMILIGKLSGVSEDKLRLRVRELYV